MVSIKSTAYPTEKLSLNEWYLYISNKPFNKIKAGGLWNRENQNTFLQQCKNILKHEK